MASTTFSLRKWLPLPPRFVFYLLLVIISFLNAIPSNYAENVLSNCKIDAIYQFGDSISDTGNNMPNHRCCHPPYGETFFEKPTGRCSDGLILVDFLAQSAEIPFIDPYLKKDGSFDHGVNFAVAGATVLPVEDAKHLSIQLGWMSSHFDEICSYEKDCLKKNERALFIVGEIGGNDYGRAFRAGKTLEETTAKVPEVVEGIKYAVKRVIEYGGTQIIVPGNFPMGCLPAYLDLFQTNDTSAYDDLRCLKDLNNFTSYHNGHLQQAIEELKEEHPNVTIVYGDYYNAFLWVFNKPNVLGFYPKTLEKACCGIGGEYNFDYWRQCGVDPAVTACSKPNERVHWDGFHMTQRSYELMAAWLIRDIYPNLHCNHTESYSSAF